MNENKNIITTDYKRFYETKASRNIGTFLLFLIWPLLSVYISFKQYKHYSSRNAIWLFTIFLGLTMYFGEDMDATRYSDELTRFHREFDINIFRFLNFVLFDPDEGRIDFVQPLITYFVSIITDEPAFLLAAFGTFYGYFYSRNIWFLIDRMKGKIRLEALAYFVLFCFLVPIWNINGFRFWAATHVFIYGVYNFIYDKKINKGVFFIIFSFFIHDTFIISIALFFAYLIIRKKTILIFYIYLITFFIGGIGSKYVTDIFDSTGIQLKDRSGYLNDGYKEGVIELNENRNWYLKYHYPMMEVLMFSSFIWIFYKRKKVLETLDYNVDFFCLGLVFFSLVNLTKDIPSMERFNYIGYMLVTTMLFIFFQNTNFKRRPDWYKIVTIVIIGLFMVVKLWSGFIFFSFATLLANPFTMFIFGNKDSFNSFIKSLLGA